MTSQHLDTNAGVSRGIDGPRIANVVSAELRKRIVAAREANGLTQAAIANRIGTTPGTISRIERGVGEEPRFLRAYLAALGLSDDAFSPPGVRRDAHATGANVASSQGVGTIQGPQLPASAIADIEDLIRNEMVNLAIDRGDSVEVIRGLRQAKPPKGATVAWWAGIYADLREQHRAESTTRGKR